MAFTIRTIDNAPLTRVREQSITTHALDTGILTGMQLSGGASGFEVDMTPGKAVINGIVIEDDLQQDPLFTLPAPTNDEHHIIFMRFNPDLDTAPVYRLDSGRYDSGFNGAAISDPTDIGHFVAIGEIFVPSTATDISDCAIINFEVIEPDFTLTKRLGIKTSLRMIKSTVLEAAGTYTLHIDDAEMIAVTHGKAWNTTPKLKPGYTTSLITGTNSTLPSYTSGQDYEISITPDAADECIVFYVREVNDFAYATTLTINAVSFGTLSPGTQPDIDEIRESFGDAGVGAPIANWPDRQDYKNIFILAVIDLESANGAVHFANGVSMRVGDEYEDGRVLAYVSDLTSTAYGTTATLVDGAVDIDELIDNAATLHDAGLDEAYDGFETGGSAGDGRVITVDAGALTLNNTPDDETPSDIWNAALRISLDNSDGGEAINHERAIDIKTVEQESERIGMVVRRPFYESDGAATLLKDVTVSLSNSGGQVQIVIPSVTVADWMTQHDENLEYAEQKWITFSTVTGDADLKSYRLRVDTGSSYFYLETGDGVDTIPATYPGDFTGLPQADAVCTVWETHIKVGQDSVVQNLEIQGELTGAGDQTIEPQLMFKGYTNIQDFVEDAALWWNTIDTRTTLIDPVAKAAFINLPYMSRGQYHPDSGVYTRAYTTSVHSGSSYPVLTDSRYVYVVEDFSGGSNAPIKVLNSSDLSLVKTISTTDTASNTHNVAIASNGEYLAIGYVRSADSYPRVEVWDIESNTQVWGTTQPGSVATTSRVRKLLMHNQELHATWYLNSTDQVWTQFDLETGTLDNDSTGGNENFARKADDGADMDCWGNHLVILTTDGTRGSSGEGFVTTLYNGDSGPVLSADGADLDAATGGGSDAVWSLACNEDYIAVMMERNAGGLATWVFEIRNDQYGGSVLSEVAEFVLDAGGGSGGQVKIIEDYVINSWYDPAPASQYVVDMWRITGGAIGPVSELYRSSSAPLGIDTDMIDLFTYDGTDMRSISLGRRPGVWIRAENSRMNGLIGPFNRLLALPSGGF